MYRIHFDPSLGLFVVQVLALGVFYRTVAGEGAKKCRTFQTYDEAIDFVKMIGLDRLYSDRSANRYNEYIQRGVAA